VGDFVERSVIRDSHAAWVHLGGKRDALGSVDVDRERGAAPARMRESYAQP
jgi:hypothetical protein